MAHILNNTKYLAWSEFRPSHEGSLPLITYLQGVYVTPVSRTLNAQLFSSFNQTNGEVSLWLN